MQPTAASCTDAVNEVEAVGAALSPVRIQIQTHTHLVPGHGRPGKLEEMRNKIARRILKTKFTIGRDRMVAYNNMFAVPGRHCFFLYDHASTPVGDEVADDKILLLWYRWTREELIALNQAPPMDIQRTMREDYPFMIRIHPPRPHVGEAVSKEELKRQRTEETPEEREKRRRELLQENMRRLDYLYNFLA